jgi:type II secretory pathway pseudopilin PulG
MTLRIRRSNSRYRNKTWQPLHGERGYALLIVMMMATILLISLTAALPSIYQEGQREREEELIFRGTEYARAIALFHRQFRRFPADVKELLQTNGIRFLRQAYPDPMTRKGKWRFIHANASGVLLDSKLRPLVTPKNPGGFAKEPEQPQQNPPEREGATSDWQESSAFFGGGSEIKGAFIVGVASMSRRESIRIWNKHTHYDEWEFLGVDMNVLGVPGGVPGQSGAPGQPGRPGQPGTPGGPFMPGRPMGPGFSGSQPSGGSGMFDSQK